MRWYLKKITASHVALVLVIVGVTVFAGLAASASPERAERPPPVTITEVKYREVTPQVCISAVENAKAYQEMIFEFVLLTGEADAAFDSLDPDLIADLTVTMDDFTARVVPVRESWEASAAECLAAGT
jgi:hypothetical protein